MLIRSGDLVEVKTGNARGTRAKVLSVQPEKGRVVVDLEGSKFAMDLLQVLSEKTKGNLTAEESGELEEILRELKMRMAAIVRMVAEQMSRAPGSVTTAPAGIPAPGAVAPAPAAPGSAASKLIIP